MKKGIHLAAAFILILSFQNCEEFQSETPTPVDLGVTQDPEPVENPPIAELLDTSTVEVNSGGVQKLSDLNTGIQKLNRPSLITFEFSGKRGNESIPNQLINYEVREHYSFTDQEMIRKVDETHMEVSLRSCEIVEFDLSWSVDGLEAEKKFLGFQTGPGGFSVRNALSKEIPQEEIGDFYDLKTNEYAVFSLYFYEIKPTSSSFDTVSYKLKPNCTLTDSLSTNGKSISITQSPYSYPENPNAHRFKIDGNGALGNFLINCQMETLEGQKCAREIEVRVKQ